MKKNKIHFILGGVEDKNGKKYMKICDYMLLIDNEMLILMDEYGEYDLTYPDGKILKCYYNWMEIPPKEFPWSLFN
jgi:hypothetical protein